MSHQHSGHVAIPGCAWALITVPSIATLSFAQMSVSSQAEILPFLGISAAGNCTAAVTAPCRLQTGHRHGRHPSRPRQAACARTTPPAAELPALPCPAQGQSCALTVSKAKSCRAPSSCWELLTSSVPSTHSAPCRIWLSQRGQPRAPWVHPPAALASLGGHCSEQG